MMALIVRRLLMTAALLIGSGQAFAQYWPEAFAASRFCEVEPSPKAVEQDRLLRLAAVIRDELQRLEARTVLISRSGLDLRSFGIPYSHAAIAWRDSNGSWTVRQLYYACEQAEAKIYDQGLAGFVLGGAGSDEGRVSIVALPAESGEALRRTVMDDSQALSVLGTEYSASAFAFSTRYQNCNQWVLEILATAWGELSGPGTARERAQRWLLSAGYAPSPIHVSGGQMLLSRFIPLVQTDDHPEEDRQARALRITLPETIEAFVRRKLPASRRVLVCHDELQAVAHDGWSPTEGECRAGIGDRVHAFQDTVQ